MKLLINAVKQFTHKSIVSSYLSVSIFILIFGVFNPYITEGFLERLFLLLLSTVLFYMGRYIYYK